MFYSFRGRMKKLFLILSLGLLAPVCDVVARPGAKKVRFASEPQVQAYKPSEPVDKTVQTKEQVATPKLSMKARLKKALLGVTMIWAGPFAMGMAIKHQGDSNQFFKALAIGAMISGLSITLSGFKKIEHAIRG